MLYTCARRHDIRWHTNLQLIFFLFNFTNSTKMFYILHTFLNNTQLQNRRIKGKVGTKASKLLYVYDTHVYIGLTTTIIISFAAGSSTEDFAFACFHWRVLMDEHAGPCPAFYRWIYSLSMLAARWHSSCLHGLRSRLSSYL